MRASGDAISSSAPFAVTSASSSRPRRPVMNELSCRSFAKSCNRRRSPRAPQQKRRHHGVGPRDVERARAPRRAPISARRRRPRARLPRGALVVAVGRRASRRGRGGIDLRDRRPRRRRRDGRRRGRRRAAAAAAAAVRAGVLPPRRTRDMRRVRVVRGRRRRARGRGGAPPIPRPRPPRRVDVELEILPRPKGVSPRRRDDGRRGRRGVLPRGGRRDRGDRRRRRGDRGGGLARARVRDAAVRDEGARIRRRSTRARRRARRRGGRGELPRDGVRARLDGG